MPANNEATAKQSNNTVKLQIFVVAFGDEAQPHQPQEGVTNTAEPFWCILKFHKSCSTPKKQQQQQYDSSLAVAIIEANEWTANINNV